MEGSAMKPRRRHNRPKREQIADFLDLLADCSGKEPIATGRDLLAEVDTRIEEEERELQERRKVFIP